jgi:hypothetical protein
MRDPWLGGGLKQPTGPPVHHLPPTVMERGEGKGVGTGIRALGTEPQETDRILRVQLSVRDCPLDESVSKHGEEDF